MGIKRSGERVMAGWFNIDYLRDPSFMKSAGGGSGYTAIGDVLSKFGGIINAERDRKYQLEQDKLKNERESKKVESEVNKNNSYVDYNNAGAFARMAQGQKYISDAEQNIRKTDGQIKHWDNTDAIGWANHNETKTHHRNTEEIQKSKSGGNGGGTTRNSGKKILQREIDEQFNSKKYSQNIDDLLNTEL